MLSAEDLAREGEWLRRFHAKRRRGDLADVVEFTQSDAVSIMRCSDCGTLLRNPQPTPKALAQRYRWDDYSTSTLEQLFNCEREFYAAKARHVASIIPPNGKILEVGSFVGAFLSSAEDHHIQATGVDIGEDTAAFARQKGLNVVQGDFKTVEISGQFDAVCIWNTFDQINQPEMVLEKAGTLLSPDGLLFVRVPNGLFEVACQLAMRCTRHAQAARMARAYNNFTTFPYLVGYSPKSMQRLLKKYGYQMKELRGEALMPLSGDVIDHRAAREEKRVKRGVMLASRLALDRHGLFLYPWMTLVAQKNRQPSTTL